MKTPETHLEYAQRVGPPRVVPCRVALLGMGDYVFVCLSHDYYYNDRGVALDGLNDRCPMSRLEEWRARRWAVAL